MDIQLLRQIADEIIRQTIWANLPYIGLLICLVTLAGAAASYGASYLARRGQQSATRADFSELQRQLAETTRLTESIKIRVQAVSERITKVEDIKREKLERYLQLAYSVSDYHMAFMSHHYFNREEPKGMPPIFEAGMLQELYLPELSIEHQSFANASAELQKWIAEGMAQQVENMRVSGTKSPPSSEHMKAYQALVGSLAAELNLLRAAASKLAAKLLQVHDEEHETQTIK